MIAGVAIATVYFMSVLAPTGELLSFASPRQLLLHCSNSCIHAVEKKVAKEKAPRIPPISCASHSCALWVFGEGFRRAIPGPAKTSGIHAAPLAGLFSPKAAMLGAE
ncbi:MAG: hypothetical protein Q8M21_08245 [Methylococcaceae bacterium]|nr:hypothetical protein [Methylococcaceae bacterium]